MSSDNQTFLSKNVLVRTNLENLAALGASAYPTSEQAKAPVPPLFLCGSRAAGPYGQAHSGANTRFLRGWCLEVHDLAIGKYIAGRPKDLTFTEALIRHRMLNRRTRDSRLASTPVGPEILELAQHRIARQFKIG